MTHYPSHKRDAFLAFVQQWSQDGSSPAQATMEVDYEPQEIWSDEFLRDFLGCSDVVPATDRVTLTEITGEPEDQVTTYAEAAHALLLQRGTRYDGLAGKLETESTRPRAKLDPDVIMGLAERVASGELRAEIDGVEVEIRTWVSLVDESGERVEAVVALHGHLEDVAYEYAEGVREIFEDPNSSVLDGMFITRVELS